jgi:hypothetical protein
MLNVSDIEQERLEFETEQDAMDDHPLGNNNS